MLRDEIEAQIRDENPRVAPMIVVSFRIPAEIENWARETAIRLEVDKSVVIRKLLELGWERVNK